MEIEELRYFISVCERQSFTEAAFECNLSQSSLSKHIRKLEHEVGFSLLQRTTHQIKITEAGKLVLAYAYEIIYKHDTCMKQLQERFDQHSIRIGCMPVISPYHIPRMFQDFKQTYPDMNIDIVESKAKDIMHHIDDYDAILIRPFLLENKAQYQIYPLYDDRLCIVVSDLHPLAKRNEVTFDEIEKEDFIFPVPGSGGYEVYNKACDKAGFSPKIIYELPQTNTMFSFVEENVGITFSFYKVYEEYRNPKLKMIPIQDPTHYPIAFVHKKTKILTSMQKTFLHHCEHFCKNEKKGG